MTNGGTTLPAYYTYDANGNVISKGNGIYGYDTYEYNSDNRMTKYYSGYSYESTYGKNFVYEYNSLGQRVYKRGAKSTHYIYSVDGQLLAEDTTKQYIYFNGAPVAFISSNQLYYIHNDHLGRAENITDTSGSLRWRVELKPFDRRVLFSSIGDYNLGFPGQYWDSEKRSWYNYFRDYDPKTGRYLQSDPIGMAAGVNTYGYVGGDPVGFVDPNGRNPKKWAGLICGGLTIGAYVFDAWSIRQNAKYLSSQIDIQNIERLTKARNELFNEIEKCSDPDKKIKMISHSLQMDRLIRQLQKTSIEKDISNWPSGTFTMGLVVAGATCGSLLK